MKKNTTIDRIDIINSLGFDLDTATIWLTGEISDSTDTALRLRVESIKKYYKECLNQDLKEVNIVLNSPGGSVHGFRATIDYFEELKKQNILVNVLATGICMSAATFIIGAATGKRSATKRCRFMIHEIHISGIEGNMSQIKVTQKETEFLEQESFDIYTSISLKGQEPTKKQFEEERKKWIDRCKKDFYFEPEKAIEFKLIDEII